MRHRIPKRGLIAAVASAILFALAGAKTTCGADKVTVLAVPGGGQPVCAKTDSQGTVHLLFDTADGPQYAKSTDRGKTFSATIPVVAPQLQKDGLKFSACDMAVGGNQVHVALFTNAWKLKLPKAEWAFFYARLDAGVPTFSPVRNINHKPSEGFSLAADDKGNVTACWLSGKLYANVSRDGGKTFASAVEIDPSFDPCDCCTTSSVYGADGLLAVLYREETDNERDMYLVLWDQRRNQVRRTRVSSTMWKIDACPMSSYAITRDREGFVAAWPTRNEVYFAHLDGKGTLQTPAEVRTPGTSGMRSGMLALTAADGGTLVAWKKDGRLHWQLYDSGGQPAGPPDSTQSAGKGVAGVLAQDDELVLFR